MTSSSDRGPMGERSELCCIDEKNCEILIALTIDSDRAQLTCKINLHLSAWKCGRRHREEDGKTTTDETDSIKN